MIVRIAVGPSGLAFCLLVAPVRAEEGGDDWDDAPLPIEPVTSEPVQDLDAGSATLALAGGLTVGSGGGALPILALQLTVHPLWWFGLDLALGEPMYVGPRFYLLPGPVSPYGFARAGLYVWPFGGVGGGVGGGFGAGAGVEFTGESGATFAFEVGPVLDPGGPAVGVGVQAALGYRFR